MNTKLSMVFMCWLLVSTIVHAEGDANLGQEIFLEDCERCHYNDDFATQDAATTAEQLRALKAGDEDHRPDLAGLSLQEIADLAAFFAGE